MDYYKLDGTEYDDTVEKKARELWNLVKADGCVMINPVLEKNIGWNVYVQLGERAQEFEAYTLIIVLDRALEEVRTWQP